MKQRKDGVEGMEEKREQAKISVSTIQKLKDAAWSIIKGDFDSSREIYEIGASYSETDEMRDLAETMGMLSVKIEAREYSLKQKIEEIKFKNEQLEQAAKLQSMSGFLFSGTIIVISFYVILISQITKTDWINAQGKTAITYCLMAVVIFVIFVYLRKYRFPLSSWGITLKGSWRALKESVFISVVLSAFFLSVLRYT
jgi:uncharacterized Tic20 family protein